MEMFLSLSIFITAMCTIGMLGVASEGGAPWAAALLPIGMLLVEIIALSVAIERNRSTP